MSEWKTYKLGDVVDMRNGKKRPKEAGNFPVYGGNGILDYTNQYNAENVIVVGRVGAYCGSVYRCKQKCWVSDNAICVNAKPIIDNNFLFYLMSSLDFHHFHIGGAQPLMTQDIIGSFEISLPPLAEQKRIADILSAIDDKIELNRRINANLEQQAQALYKSWFVDNKKDDWEEKRLDDIISIYDSQRKPLSGQQREKMEKLYPYYGAASLMDYVDNYLFDGIYLLLGEDGTVSDSEGFPMLQYVWGKFWVNNHAHILQGKNGFTTESLYILLKQTNVSSIVTGAVQPKISQANLKSVPIIMPPINLLNQYNDIIKPLFDQIRTNQNQIQQLSTLRDTLLPKLMNGEIKI